MFKYFQYDSLGNRFILFDWLNQSNELISNYLNHLGWPKYVRTLCHHSSGLKSDGILILKNNSVREVEILIFNADGSNGEFCLNGLRCAAHYLFTKKDFPEKFYLKMNYKSIACEMNEKFHEMVVRIQLDRPIHKKTFQLSIGNKLLLGHVIDAGNPHFVLLQKTTKNWLSKYGSHIENHPEFPHRTNVEFVWPDDQIKHYRMLIHERGCGMTAACGSGAAAVMRVLHGMGFIQTQEKIHLNMPGGSLISYIDEQNKIIQEAGATVISDGITKDIMIEK